MLQVRDHYRARFPELESLVHHPVDYARVVAAIGNEVSITLLRPVLLLRRLSTNAALHVEPLVARAPCVTFVCMTSFSFPHDSELPVLSSSCFAL